MARLLIVEDQEEIHQLLARLFRDHETQSAHTGAEALEIARSWSPDLIICDHCMPGMTGVETLTALRSVVPNAMRILTSALDRDILITPENPAGIHLFLEKPFHIQSVRLAVEGLLREQQLRTEKEELASELKHATRSLSSQQQLLEFLVEQRTQSLLQVKEDLERSNSELEDSNLELSRTNQRLRESLMRDELTCLYNRGYICEQLRVEIARAARYDRPLAVLFADIDNFKQVNDLYGHQVGDDVLTQFGKFFQSPSWRATDLAGRYGGEEFLILLPETDPRGAILKGEKLRREIRRFNWSEIHPDLKLVTASFGAAFYPADGDTFAELIGTADQRLYQAKRCGKDKLVVNAARRVDPQMQSRLANGTQNIPTREPADEVLVALPPTSDTPQPIADHDSKPIRKRETLAGEQSSEIDTI